MIAPFAPPVGDAGWEGPPIPGMGFDPAERRPAADELEPALGGFGWPPARPVDVREVVGPISAYADIAWSELVVLVEGVGTLR